MKTYLLFCALSLCAVLAACGDSNTAVVMPPPVVSNEVPASAGASSSAFAQYIASLGTVVGNDFLEPLGMNSFTPPTSETEEPQAI